MKYALVTGADGFVGRHISAELQRRGWQVHKVEITRGESFADYLALDEAWSSAPYDLVVHCAYHVGGRAAIDGRNMNLAANLSLDAALFDWAVRTGQGRVLYFSSSAAYPVWMQRKDVVQDPLFQSYGGVPRRLAEDDVHLDDISTPDADYGYAKLTGERLARSARKNGLAVTVVRPFSGYGEDQSVDYPFPAIVKRAQAGDLTVWGPPGQTRDWIHISDVCAGALAVCEAEYDGPVNLCTGVGTEMGELAMMAWRTAECPRAGWIDAYPQYDPSKPTGVFYRVGDPTLMETFYTPKVSLEEGIARALRV